MSEDEKEFALIGLEIEFISFNEQQTLDELEIDASCSNVNPMNDLLQYNGVFMLIKKLIRRTLKQK